jgi:hypothetical protein
VSYFTVEKNFLPVARKIGRAQAAEFLAALPKAVAVMPKRDR